MGDPARWRVRRILRYDGGMSTLGSSIGIVHAVRGAEITLARETGSTLRPIEGDRIGAIGSFVTLPTPLEILIGMVSAIEGPSATAATGTLTFQLIGAIRDGRFTRGMGTSPIPGERAYVPTQDQVLTLLGHEAGAPLIPLGTLPQFPDIPVTLDLNKLLSRHALIVGSTGSGKSTTVATLVLTLLERYAHPYLVIFDVHGEYGGLRHPKMKLINGHELKIPHWLLSLQQWGDLLHLEPQSQSLTNLGAALQELKAKYNPEFDRSKLSVDTPIFYRLFELTTHPKVTHDPTLNERLPPMSKDVRYAPLFQSGYEYLGGLTAFTDLVLDRRQGATILDLSHLVPDLLSPVVEIFSRLFFEFCYWNTKRDFPLVLVYEEGHRYLSADPVHASSRKRVENIVKEGRKYGVGAIIVSQRPTEISPTILAQCGNIIAHRLTTDQDRQCVKNLLPESLVGFTSLLPSLATGEMLLAGDAASLPLRSQVKYLQKLPSVDCDYHAKWTHGPGAGFSSEAILKNWLDQTNHWPDEDPPKGAHNQQLPNSQWEAPKTP